jgi:2-iminobutanoate/2-iminopropanoate deaminase
MNKSIVFSDQAPAPIGPYSQAVKTGNTLYVSGQIPLNASTGQLINSGIADETDRVMSNISFILIAAGMDFNNVVKCSIFVTDMNDFAVVNETYQKYFDQSPPARETVEVSALPKGVHVEISCIAVDL